MTAAGSHAPRPPATAGDFFSRVHALVRRIPRGRVATYGQIAALLGSPGAARTVGWALRALPDGTDVPWHRVINARGRISTGRCEHGGGLQAELLRRERVRVRPAGDVPLDRHRWVPGNRSASARRRPRLHIEEARP